ncbi:hypothetical protein BpHYR1_030596 [Brachionus plicatilis]|uniref:Uncharacterized protein n=1 Tax=Brachionus plicatilis TaxID=10195 RepID=A0A3M7RFA9_BRAPC|nr:hypothetical protein BpHYR1_030596 [Brachionus plicatilis]
MFRLFEFSVDQCICSCTDHRRHVVMVRTLLLNWILQKLQTYYIKIIFYQKQKLMKLNYIILIFILQTANFRKKKKSMYYTQGMHNLCTLCQNDFPPQFRNLHIRKPEKSPFLLLAFFDQSLNSKISFGVPDKFYISEND